MILLLPQSLKATLILKNRGECRLNDRFKRILKFNQKDINTRWYTQDAGTNAWCLYLRVVIPGTWDVREACLIKCNFRAKQTWRQAFIVSLLHLYVLWFKEKWNMRKLELLSYGCLSLATSLSWVRTVDKRFWKNIVFSQQHLHKHFLSNIAVPFIITDNEVV